MLSEIEVYGRHLARVGIEMDAFDFDLLCRLDGVWMTAQAATVTKPDPDAPPDPPVVRPAGERP